MSEIARFLMSVVCLVFLHWLNGSELAQKHSPDGAERLIVGHG